MTDEKLPRIYKHSGPLCRTFVVYTRKYLNCRRDLAAGVTGGTVNSAITCVHDDGGLSVVLVDEHYLNSEVFIFVLFGFRNVVACDQKCVKVRHALIFK